MQIAIVNSKFLFCKQTDEIVIVDLQTHPNTIKVRFNYCW